MSYLPRRTIDRERKQRQANKLLREIRQHDKAMRINSVIYKYTEAYKAANGRMPQITYKNGWFTVGREPYRQIQVERMTATLWARVHEKELNAPIDNEEKA